MSPFYRPRSKTGRFQKIREHARAAKERGKEWWAWKGKPAVRKGAHKIKHKSRKAYEWGKPRAKAAARKAYEKGKSHAKAYYARKKCRK